MKARVAPGKAVASFDSATGMLRALSRYLHGRDVPLLGQARPALEPALSALAGTVNAAPRRIQERVYAASGWNEAIPARRTAGVHSDDLAQWVAGHYPRRRAEVAFVGSSNGALVHLAAALGVPWLPQTLLVPVRRRGAHPDDPRADLAAVQRAGEALLAANPDLVLHHMHDPNQDRLMIAGMTYFRVKWRRLPGAYRSFLLDTLPRGTTLVVVDCRLRWPVSRVADRYVFQHGALGGATVDEYEHGGPRVADYLARYRSPHRSWDYPPADAEAPEAEWGFEPQLLDDLAALARTAGWTLLRLSFETPEDLSVPVADLYRAWYRARGLPADRLLAECFLLLEPWWTLRSGSVPYWMVFNSERSVAGLASYLDAADRADEPYDEIRMVLFSHGVESVGLAPIADWERLLAARARKIGVLTGVDRDAYPRDFASFVRAHRELSRIRTIYPMPLPLDWPTARDALTARRELQLQTC